MRTGPKQLEVHRNRFRTNWVAAWHKPQQNESRRDARSWQRPVVITAGLCIIAFVAMTMSVNEIPRASHSVIDSSTKAPPAAPEPCSQGQLVQILKRTGVAGQTKLPLPFAMGDRVVLGGESFVSISCSEPHGLARFDTEWRLDSAGWQLKKISRKPIG
jgi:hypothetical protein